MSYKIKNGEMVRTGKRRPLTLYHFTFPRILPEIIKNGIYPFANPKGNQITEAYFAWIRKHGNRNLIAQCEAGRQFIFGCNDGGVSARITVQLPRNFEGLFNYLELIRYQNFPLASFVAEMPGVADWWVVASPADSDSFLGIGPGAVTAVQSVGDPSPEYLAAVEQITAECERAA